MLAAVQSAATAPVTTSPASGGGRFDFDDGGTYCGDWEEGKAHGHGVCTGPKGQGEYAGQWAYGFEVSGVYTWPSGNNYEGQWMGGKRHGLGVEAKGRWIYRGEWTHGFKGRYGVRQSISSGAKYEGTWANGLQDGYGIEFYADGGTFQGQWLRGVRHGYGVRSSAPYGLASHYRHAKALRSSLTSLRSEADEDGSVLKTARETDTRGGFVLRTCSDEPPPQRRGSIFSRKKGGSKKIGGGLFAGLKLRKQQSTGDLPQQRRGKASSLNSSSSIQSYVSDGSSIQSAGALTDVDLYDGDSNLSYVSTEEILESNVTEIYMGEWKNDKRAGFGVCDRSDGLKYEGEWFNNKKSGYGITTFKDGSKEEGKYRNNVLVTSSKQRKLLVRSSKLRERIDSSVQAAIRASQIALQKADIAISRTASARGKAETADQNGYKARSDSDKSRVQAKLYAPSFYQPGVLWCQRRQRDEFISRELKSLEEEAPGSRYSPDVIQKPYGHMVMNEHRSTNLLHSPQALQDSPTFPRSHERHNPVPNRVPPTPTYPQAAAPAVRISPVAATPSTNPYAASPRTASPVAPNAATDHVAAGGAGPTSAIIKPFTQLHVSSSSVPSSQEFINPSMASPSSLSPVHLMPNGGVDYPEDFSGSRRGSRAKPVLQRMEGFDADLSGTKFARVSRQADRFSQYGAKREDSGIGSEIGATPGESAGDLPASGELESLEQISLPSLQRRKSLPSLVKRDITGSLRYPEDYAKPETILIEGGTRKRLVATEQPGPPPRPYVAPTLPNPRTPVILPKTVVAEPIKPKLSKSELHQSFTDLSSADRQIKSEPMTRQEATQLGSRRREEIRKQREYEASQTEFDRFRAQMKDICKDKQLLMLVIVLNVSLSLMFYQLLSPSPST